MEIFTGSDAEKRRGLFNLKTPTCVLVMMKPLKLTYLHITLISSVALLFEACSLDDDYSSQQLEGNVKVEMNWTGDSDHRPEGMSVLFYPTDGSPYWRFELQNSGGGVKLPIGTYNVLAFNSDTSNIIFENINDYNRALVSSQTSPDDMWAANTYTFKTKGFSQTLRLYIRPVVANYTVEVHDIGNIESCYQADFEISGLSAGRYLSSMDHMTSNTFVTGKLANSGSSMLGQTKGFGRIPGNGESLLKINFRLRDGSSKQCDFDITETMDNAEDPYNVTITVSGIELPSIETSTPDSGLDVGIDDWDTIDIELTT